MKFLKNRLVAEEGFILRSKNDDGIFITPEHYIEPTLSYVVYLAKQLQDETLCFECYEEIDERDLEIFKIQWKQKAWETFQDNEKHRLACEEAIQEAERGV